MANVIIVTKQKFLEYYSTGLVDACVVVDNILYGRTKIGTVGTKDEWVVLKCPL